MSVHHVGYIVAKCGFTFEPTWRDYGYDGSIDTFDASGEVENGELYVQLKATDKLKWNKDQTFVQFRVGKRDIDFWGGEIFPVYLIIFDVPNERAYWTYFQNYLEMHNVSAATMKAGSLLVSINAQQVVNEAAVQQWRADKLAVIAQIGSITHA